MSYIESYHEWCNNPYFDSNTKKELESIANNETEIKDRFYKNLTFGTGGLRGILGAGINRLNIYTIRKATQGLANFIIKEDKTQRGVVIAYDSRHMSREFSEETALCLNANGIITYIFDSLRPTPELSFAVRELNCIAGIVITASHNPPEYNGYKVYGEDGAQITAPTDKRIISEVNAVTDFNQVKTISKEAAIKMGLYNIVDSSVDDKYMNCMKSLIQNQSAIDEYAGKLKIVYTPLNGTGNVPVRRILSETGFKNVVVVPEQEMPDGDFPTLKSPNPEDPNAFQLALELAEIENADIVLATDPDADRLGLYVKDTNSNAYIPFTGNMTGILIAEYELSQMREKNLLPSNGALLKTIVSSNMGKALAKEYNITLIEVLTGFKYIGEQISLFEQNHSYEYLFGYEESYGCLLGTYARDKDAVVSIMAICEAAAYYKSKGLTLWDEMLILYNKYGFYKEGQASITLKGIDGSLKIKEILETLRTNPPMVLGGFQVKSLRDYKSGIITNLKNHDTAPTNLPNSNVLYYELENDSWCCVRPSGTEPKCKFYFGVKDTSLEGAEQKLNDLKEDLLSLVKE